jgi:hypothetical protein
MPQGKRGSKNKSTRLDRRIAPEGLSRDEIDAHLTVNGLLPNAMLAVQFSQEPMGDVALSECLEALTRTASDVQSGNWPPSRRF